VELLQEELPFYVCLEHSLGICNLRYFQTEERPYIYVLLSWIRDLSYWQRVCPRRRSLCGLFGNTYLLDFCPITAFQGAKGLFRDWQSWAYIDFYLSGEFNC